MQKRKNEEIALDEVLSAAVHPALKRLIMVGVGVLMAFTVIGLFYWQFAKRIPAIPTAPYVTRAPQIVNKPADLPLARDVSVIANNSGGDIWKYHPGGLWEKLKVRGYDVTAAGGAMAYVRDAHLYVYRYPTETRIILPGAARFPAWSADGRSVAVLVSESSGDSVYRVDARTLQTTRLLTMPEITAPPVSDPGTNRVVIVERRADRRTTFYTIDPAMPANLHQMGTVDYLVDWVSYHPSGTAIAFSEVRTGNIYLISIGAWSVTPLLVTGKVWRRPEFSADGARLMLLNADNQLCIYDLRDKNLYGLRLDAVLGGDWAE